MRKLVQKLVDIDPVILSNPEGLQRRLDEMSSKGWEYSGQIGLYYVFKRWEEETKVYEPTYKPPYTPPYTPSQFGTPVYGNNSYAGRYTTSPFDED